jgi:diguanylate cyclase (GGDEF)-like protein
MDTMPLAAKRAVAFSSISPFVPILISALVLYGWLFDIPNLQSVLSGFPTMKVNTALCFIFSGLSLLLWHRADPAAPTHWNMAKPWAITLASLTLIISGVTLGQYIFSFNAGIDEFLLEVPQTDNAPPGRMSAITALEFMLISISLLLVSDQKIYCTLSQSIAAIAFFIAFLSLLAYLYGSSMEQVDWFSTIAVHTAMNFLLISAAAMCLKANKAWVAVFFQDSNSSRLGRLYLFSSFLLLPLLAEFRAIGQRELGLYGTYFGIAILTTSGLAILTAVNWLGTRRGNNNDDEIENLNRVYAFLSKVNMLIVRAKTPEQLFRETCHIAHRTGGFPWVWIISIDQQSKTLAAWEGGNETLLKRMQVRLSLDSENIEKSSLIQRAIETEKPVVLNDLNADKSIFAEQTLPLDELEAFGIQSLVLLPLFIEDQLVAVLALHSFALNFFDDSEMFLLNELAGDISYSLNDLKKEETLNYLSLFDPLTGLANRTNFIDLVSRSIVSAKKNSKKVCLIIFDIKGFRFINEYLGQPMGDKLLKLVAGRLLRIAPQPETLARLQADCFAAIMTYGTAVSIENKIRKLLHDGFGNEPFSIGDEKLDIKATLGIAIYPDDAKDAETLLKNAEATLKEAKQKEVPFLFYEPEINSRVVVSFKLEQKLRAALEQNQFILHYQPKYDYKSSSFREVEALIRWHDPETGLVPPGMFIPLLEQSGFIREVGEWALNQAVTDILKWKDMGLNPPRVAVNVSSIQLRSKKFTGTVVNALANFGDMPSMLDIEITESMVMEDVKRATTMLKTLRNVGIEVSIDDFGTGYSSLSYLVQLPVNTLKIDRAFVNEMTKSELSLNLVSAIISLAHSLHIKVVAEGVETEEQAKVLSELSCDLMQGFLFSKPLPFDELATLLPPLDTNGNSVGTLTT